MTRKNAKSQYLKGNMRNYCTLFDSKYAAFGMALYQSLLRHESHDFRLYVLCLDDAVMQVLSELKLDKVILIDRKSVFPELVADASKLMTAAQICWLFQPLLCRYVLNQFDVDHVVYMDSDCYFMNSPDPLWQEIKNAGAVATMVPHRFPVKLDYLAKVSGKYCVQFNYFDRSESARKVLECWTEDCLKYNKNFPDIYPGQLSLDHWTSISSKVHAIKNNWAGVAVWNLLNIDWTKLKDHNPVIFYHFHGLYFMENDVCDLGWFKMPRQVIWLIYKPYLQELLQIRSTLENRFPNIQFIRIKSSQPEGFWGYLRKFWITFKRRVKRVNNIYPLSSITGL